jgi:hypothetical protein
MSDSKDSSPVVEEVKSFPSIDNLIPQLNSKHFLNIDRRVVNYDEVKSLPVENDVKSIGTGRSFDIELKTSTANLIDFHNSYLIMGFRYQNAAEDASITSGTSAEVLADEKVGKVTHVYPLAYFSEITLKMNDTQVDKITYPGWVIHDKVVHGEISKEWIKTYGQI